MFKKKGDGLRILFYVFVINFLFFLFTANLLILVLLLAIHLMGKTIWLKYFAKETFSQQEKDYQDLTIKLWPIVVLMEFNTFDEEKNSLEKPGYCQFCRRPMEAEYLLRANCTSVEDFPAEDENYQKVPAIYCVHCDTFPNKRLVICLKTKPCPFLGCPYKVD